MPETGLVGQIMECFPIMFPLYIVIARMHVLVLQNNALSVLFALQLSWVSLLLYRSTTFGTLVWFFESHSFLYQPVNQGFVQSANVS